MRNRNWLGLSNVLLLLGLCGCVGMRKDTEIAAAKALISDDEEAQLGAQFKQELEKKGEVHYLKDDAVTAYVRSVSDKVIAFAKKDRPNINWQVFVLDEPKTVNAFATPGGYLYVYTGLLIAAANEAEVAGVMSHEAGHVVARHSARSIVDAYGLETVTQIVLGKQPALLQQVANLGAQGVLLAHSRSDENEADEYGATYASAAGYDPHGIVTFFQKLMAQSGGEPPAALSWLSTHPATPDRIAHMNGFIAQHNLHGAMVGAERLAPIKQRLAALASNRPSAPAPASK